MITPQEGSPVYRKLDKGETFALYPGHTFRIGAVELTASRFNVGKFSHIGCRPSMEDTHLICHNLFVYEGLPVSFYSVYDGHGGSQCSTFLKEILHIELRKTILECPSRHSDVINCLVSSIKSTFSRTDQIYADTFPTVFGSVGSAAIVCLIVGDRIITANLGDSRAVLSRGGKAINLSIDHRPSNEKELERIYKGGGEVSMGRIHSRLSISRAFGDFDYKTGNKGKCLSIEPDITQIFIDPEQDEFIVIGCDGLFEAYSSQEIVDSIRNRLAAMQPTEQDPNRVIREIINEAVFENKTTDNVTALLITLTSGIIIY